MEKKKEGEPLSPLVGRKLFAMSPPSLKVKRRADSLKSGLLHLGEAKAETLDRAIGESVRVFGGKPGQYHTMEAARRYPYGKACINFGGLKSQITPRIYFSKPIMRDPNSHEPHSVQYRYDYDARFPLGTGPMALDKDNRIIHAWSSEMEDMAGSIWAAMKEDKRYRCLCKQNLSFNHVSVHMYRAGNFLQPHEDRRRQRRREQR